MIRILLTLMLTGCSLPTFYGDNSYTVADYHSLARVVYRAHNVLEHKTGTAFSIKVRSGRTYIVTNAHVCNMQQGVAKFLILESQLNMTRQFADVIAVDTLDDLCLLTEPYNYSMSGIKEYSVDAVIPLEMGENPRRRFASTYYMGGHPDGAVFRIEARVDAGDEIVKIPEESQHPEEFRDMVLNPACIPGESGSPVINRYMALVGIIHATNLYKNECFVVPVQALKDFVERVEADGPN